MKRAEWVFRVEAPYADDEQACIEAVRVPAGLMSSRQAAQALIALAARFEGLTASEIVHSFVRRGSRSRLSLLDVGEDSTRERLILSCGPQTACTAILVHQQAQKAAEPSE